MYHGKYEARHLQRRHKRRSKKTGMLFLSLLLVATMMVGGTLAWLSTKSAPITNTFLPSHVSCSVAEEFNGTTKSNVNVTNTGDIDAFTAELWDNLNEDNKISLFVRFTDLGTGAFTQRILNKNQ